MYATSGTSKIESTKGSLEGKGAGLPVGNMTGISIDTSGKIYGSYDNGTKKLLGQIAVATFANPSGLESIGDSMFAETMNSGEFDGVGQDPTQGGGSLSTGVLEMSNVDLSSEFTNMIITQRGFQANSRIITVSDTMLEELINLKR
jgi:flagellar hook protein FlgE